MLARVLTVTAAALALAGTAAAGTIDVRDVDTARYPHVVVTAVTPTTAKPRRVLENGRRVEGLELERVGDAKAVVLAIDRSRSMAGRPLADAARAARGFVAAKGPSDRLAIVGFGSRAVSLTGFSGATIDADGALRSLEVDRRAGTALYDAIVVASRALGRESLRGRVLVLLTDGRNSGGAASLDAAIRAARASRTLIYSIAITSDRPASAALRRLSRATGGRFYAVAQDDLGAAYASIGRELRRTWRISYASVAVPGTHARITVEGAGAGNGTAGFVAPGTRGGSPAARAVVGGGWTALVLALLVAGLLYAAIRVATRKPSGSELRTRLRGHLGADATTDGAHAPRTSRLRPSLAAVVLGTEERLSRLRHWHKLERLLERSAVPLRPGELVYVVAGAGAAAALVATAAGGGPLTALALLLLAAASPIGVLRLKASRRARAFDEQLPDLLAAVAASLRAGFSFKQGLQSVVDEIDAPAKTEFGRVLAEARLGRPLDEALDAMVERLGSDDLEYVATAVSVQEQVGGSLAGLFEMISDTVRERQQHRRKVRSLTAMGRASAYVLTVLPFGMAALITLINPSYMAPLYHSGPGHFLLILGMTMIGVGALVLRRIVTVRG